MKSTILFPIPYSLFPDFCKKSNIIKLVAEKPDATWKELCSKIEVKTGII